VIGEIGTGDPIHPNERKCLLAAGLASRRSGAPVYVHTYPWAQEGVQAAELLLEQAVEPDRIVICHVDVELADGYLRALLDRGVFVEFDNFGKEFTIDRSDRVFAGGIFARDIDRVRAIRRLVDGGWVRQILITNDICLKSMLHAYGGWGYDHILRHVVPMMLDEGIDAKVVEMLLVGNPARLLSR
jgi:phosphotriesterase-related protein